MLLEEDAVVNLTTPTPSMFPEPQSGTWRSYLFIFRERLDRGREG